MYVPPPKGKYGIDSTRKVVEAGNSLYDLVAATYLDDRQFKQDDLLELISQGPAVATKVIAAAGSFGNVDEEIQDLDEGEKLELASLVGARFKHPGYSKIIKGLFEIVDGISEITNPENPTN